MIQFPFQDYKTVAFSEDAAGTNTIYTTEYKSLVCIEVTNTITWDLDDEGSTESVKIYGEPTNLNNVVDIWHYGSAKYLLLISSSRFIGVTSTVFENATPIKAKRDGQSVTGILHVFRLPVI